jgi:hypothetical protein
MIIEKNIHKFITHIVNNWNNGLNEAYSEAIKKQLFDKFREQADDLQNREGDLPDEKLKRWIDIFDQKKEKFKEKDLFKYSLDDLETAIASVGGVKERETGPDVIYSRDGITVYNGENEELCQRHRDDVPWCITRGSFGNYRWEESRKFPSFYLIKNDTEKYRDDEKLAFVAIQVRNTSNESEKYIWTPKDNKPNESKPMSWSQLISDIPWLDSIPNIKDMLKYISLSPEEKVTNIFSKTAISIRQWTNLSPEIKKQYLVVRKKEENLFNDISKDEFIANYLPKHPEVSTFVAVTSDLLDSILLLKNLDKFSPNNRKSITANLRTFINKDELVKDTLPFDVKKLAVILKKWDLENNERLYVTKDGEYIVKLKFTGGDVQVGLYSAKGKPAPNIKLNANASKYLLDYPEIDKIPFNTLIKLTNNEVIDKSFIEKIIVKAEEDPNSAIAIKDVEDGQILLDSNTFTSYKIKDGKISSIPFNDEEVQKVLSTETNNTGFQESAVNLVFQQKDLSPLIDKDAFLDILKNTSYNKRTKDGSVILIDDNPESASPIFAIPTEIPLNIKTGFSYGRGDTWNKYFSRNQDLDEDTIKPYFNYLRSKNVGFNDETLIRWLDSSYTSLAKKIISSNPPMNPNSIYYPAVIGDKYVLINKSNPAASKAIGKNSTFVRANVPLSVAREITGVGAEQTPRAPRTPRSAAPQAAVAPNATVNAALDFNRLTAGFNSLPTSIKSRIGGGDVVPYNRRNASVDAIGRVRTFIQNGQSKFYIIRLNSGTIIGFATMQPDARHYIVTSTTSYQVPRVGQLASVLQQRNISEGTKTALRMHAAAYPEEANEIKKILQKLKIK